MDVGARVKQSGLEIPERGADFVQHRRSVLTDFAGEPEQLPLTLHLLLDQLCFVRRRASASEELVSDARLQSQESAARGFGRMRCENRTPVQSEHRAIDLVRGAAHLAELPHCPAYRGRLENAPALAE